MNAAVGVVGAGLVGCSWAVIFSRAGQPVVIYDEDPSARARAGREVERMLGDLPVSGTPGAVRVVGDLKSAVSSAEYIQECVPEVIDLKREVLAAIAAVAMPRAVIASSTSALVPSTFTSEVLGRERTIVAHPFNPPHLHTAVEVVPAPWTSESTLERTRALLEAVGMQPIVLSEELDGFVVNRLQAAVLHEAFRLVASGIVRAADIDSAVRGALAPRWALMGLFETIDLNAPKGIGDYVERYEPMYQRIAASQRETVSWGEVLDQGVLEDRSIAVPRDELDSRRAWRDRMLVQQARARSSAASQD